MEFCDLGLWGFEGCRVWGGGRGVGVLGFGGVETQLLFHFPRKSRNTGSENPFPDVRLPHMLSSSHGFRCLLGSGLSGCRGGWRSALVLSRHHEFR